MNKKIKALMVFGLAMLFAVVAGFADEICKNGQYQTISGVLVDARDYVYSAGQFSETDEALFHRAEQFGPFYGLISNADGSFKPVYPEGAFWGTNPNMSIDELDANADKKITPFLNQQVTVTGCVNNSANWPSVSKISKIEIAT